MSLKNAWLGLIGRLPDAPPPRPEVVEVERLIPVGDSVVTVYQASSVSYRKSMGRAMVGRLYGGLPKKPEWDGYVYMTCAEVFANHGDDAEASAHKVWVQGEKAYRFAGLEAFEIRRKPKVAKGRKS